MTKYSGTSVYKGIAQGRVHICTRKDINVSRTPVDDPEEELHRFYIAKDTATRQLHELYTLAVDEVGEENAAIFNIHAMMLEDFSFVSSIENIITNMHSNAEYAVSVTGQSFYDMFLGMDDAYMQARSADVRDICARLLTILYGSKEERLFSDEPAIILADDLSPSETVLLAKGNIVAFATVHGSVSSHTAILARTMKMPALVGTNVDISPDMNGKNAVVDSYEGCIYIDPDQKLIRRLEQKHREELSKTELLKDYKGKDNITEDGRRIKIYANVGSMEELEDAVENDAGGIGLLRSEFIYRGKSRFPTEEELFCTYKAAVQKMNGKEVTIRMLDVGADRGMDYYGLPTEKNPALGCRGIRYLLSRPDVFKTQLKAIYRAAPYGNVSVLYPMISTLVDIGRIRKINIEVKCELIQAGVAFGDIRHGALIETPSAVIISDLLAREMDFLSIGTNDLAQYAMGVDRENSMMNEFFDPINIALFRMIKMTIDNAHRWRKTADISGEMGSDPSLTEIFLAMGADGLSVTPSQILPLRQKVCSTNIGKVSQDLLQQLW